jgi:hypothetical protein
MGSLVGMGASAAKANTNKGYADGGIIGGTFQPIPAFANGAVNIDKPTVGLVGEGRYPEAIVPLPDGRSIPAKLEGLGSNLDEAFSKLADKMGAGSRGGDTKIVNVLDPTMVKSYLGTREGEKVIVNIMRENKGAVQ